MKITNVTIMTAEKARQLRNTSAVLRHSISEEIEDAADYGKDCVYIDFQDVNEDVKVMIHQELKDLGYNIEKMPDPDGETLSIYKISW